MLHTSTGNASEHVNIWTECIWLLYDIRSSWNDIITLSCSTVAFSTKPKHPSAIPTTEKKTKKGKRKGKGKGKGRKKNPCLEEYKDFCIHGVCQHLKELNTHSCVWVFFCYSLNLCQSGLHMRKKQAVNHIKTLNISGILQYTVWIADQNSTKLEQKNKKQTKVTQ